MNIERGFRRMTVVLSVGVVGLLAWLILWPALTSVMDALSWVERPYRFILPTDAGRYLVGATYPITEDIVRGLFLLERMEPNQDERMAQLFPAPLSELRVSLGLEDPWSFVNQPRGTVITGPRQAVWLGVTLYLFPYLLLTILFGSLPWALFFLCRWVGRGFSSS
jgi:hypothetical protein